MLWDGGGGGAGRRGMSPCQHICSASLSPLSAGPACCALGIRGPSHLYPWRGLSTRASSPQRPAFLDSDPWWDRICLASTASSVLLHSALPQD